MWGYINNEGSCGVVRDKVAGNAVGVLWVASVVPVGIINQDPVARAASLKIGTGYTQIARVDRIAWR